LNIDFRLILRGTSSHRTRVSSGHFFWAPHHLFPSPRSQRHTTQCAWMRELIFLRGFHSSEAASSQWCVIQRCPKNKRVNPGLEEPAEARVRLRPLFFPTVLLLVTAFCRSLDYLRHHYTSACRLPGSRPIANLRHLSGNRVISNDAGRCKSFFLRSPLGSSTTLCRRKNCVWFWSFGSSASP
jgi:hypothetical protein